MNLLNMFLTATESAANAPKPYSSLILIVAMVAVMYFIVIRPQKKKQKEEQLLRDNLQIGDEITTIGGIVGKVVTIKEDTVVIETGADRVKIKFLRGAIQTNNTASDKLQAEREAAKKAAQDAKAEKKGKKKLTERAEEIAEKKSEEKTEKKSEEKTEE